ncbi:MAG: hypothetical protein QE269_13300 [Fimbriimonas sp.]|jgi:hypothetical protein|nr:hypothetical protein [Fimbriimonas sp.]
MANPLGSQIQQNYIKSIKDPHKKRFAESYIGWLVAGKSGGMPDKGRLTTETAKAMINNMDSLA